MTEPDDAAGEGPQTAPTPTSPRVFVSYAHGSAEHEDTVRQLWLLLRSQGIDARLDLPAAEARQNWPAWMSGELRDAEFVLVIASTAYRERAAGEAPPGTGRGVWFEAALIRDAFYGDPKAGLERFLPVLLPGVTTAEIPDFLLPNGGGHFRVESLTPEGIERLLRVLTGQPYETQPPLGEVPHLPTRDAAPQRDLPALEPPPVLAHELVLDIALDDGRLRCTTTLAGTPLGEHDAPLPPGLNDVWTNLSSAGAPGRLIGIGQSLTAVLLDDATLAHVVELIDRSPFGTVVDVVFVAEGSALARPFELLRLPGQRLLATVPGVRVRRRIRDSGHAATPPMGGPLKILCAVAAPSETRTKNAPLDHEAEMQAILDALAGVDASRAAQVRILEVAGPDEIKKALQDDQYHVLHLSAHGSPSAVELEDEDGGPVPVSAAELVDVLRAGGKALPLVVLSSCASGAGGSAGLAATLVAGGADRVLAMQSSVTERYATRLARELYAEMARPGPVTPASALAAARIAVVAFAGKIERSGGPQWPTEYALPTLFCAAGDPQLVDPETASAPLSAPTIAPSGNTVRRLPIGQLIGRRDELREAMAVLRGGQAAIDRYGAVSGVLLTGVGGIGKTALAGRMETRLAAEGWMPAVVFGRWNPSALSSAVAGALTVAGDDRLGQAGELLVRADVDDTARLQVVAQLLAQTKLLLLFDDFEQNLTFAEGEVAFTDPGFEEIFGQLCEVAAVGRLLVTSRYPVPGTEGVLHRVPIRSLSPAELRRLLLRLPALRDLAGEDRRAVIDTIGGHPRLLEFVNALLRGDKSNLREVAARLRKLSPPGEKAKPERAPAEAIRDAIVLGSRDILLDELWGTLGIEQRELLLQAAVSREPQSLDELAVSRWGPDGAGERRADVVVDAEHLVDLTLLSTMGADEVVMHPWIAGALDDRGADGHAERHARAAAMRLLRTQAGRWSFGDLIEVCRHHAGAARYEDLLAFAFAAVDAIAGRFGELSVAAFLGEVVPLVPTTAGDFLALADRESQALMLTASLNAALQRAQALLRLTTEVAAADPTNTEAQRDLSISFNKLGDLLLRLGDGPAAERHYRNSLTIREQLATAHPTNTQAQRDLSISYNNLGDLLLRLGDGPAAERHYRNAHTILDRLATADPTNTEAQRDLSISYNKLGDLLLRRGDGPAAERHYRNSLTIREQLATADPNNTQVQRDLSVSFNRLGDLLLRLGDGPGAERHYSDGLTIAEQLATADPTNTEAQRDLSISYSKLGDLLLRLGDGPGAERRYRDSLTITEQLATADPTNTQAQRDLSIAYIRLGDLLLRLDDGPGAERHYRDSLTITEQLATADPTNTEVQRDLSVAYIRLGELLLRLDDGPGAERHYRNTHAILDRLATADPTNTEAQRDLSVSHNTLGDLLLRLEDAPAAERHYRDSLTIAEQLATADPTNTEAQRDLSISYNKLGDLLLRLGDGPGAERHYRDSLTSNSRPPTPPTRKRSRISRSRTTGWAMRWSRAASVAPPNRSTGTRSRSSSDSAGPMADGHRPSARSSRPRRAVTRRPLRTDATAGRDYTAAPTPGRRRR